MLPLTDEGDVDVSGLDAIARECNVKVVSTNLVSNSLGTISDLSPLVSWAHGRTRSRFCRPEQHEGFFLRGTCRDLTPWPAH